MKNYSRHYEEDALPGFSEFRYLTREGVNLATMAEFGYQPHSRPLFNSFARRLRLASSIESVNIVNYGEDTANGYEALNKHFVMFSAFERYATDVEGITHGEYHKALAFIPDEVFAQIHDAFALVDTNSAIFDFLLSNANSRLQRDSLMAFRNKFSPRKGLYISALLRNCFAHGVITANPRNAPEKSIERLCNFMTDLLYKLMREDFRIRLERVKEELNK